MPSYEYRCPSGHVLLETWPIGTARRTRSCVGCNQRMQLVIGAGVNIAPSALENKGERVREVNATEKEWDVDRPAYKRMRRRGLQPDHIKGSAQLEDKVEDNFDIKYGDLYDRVPKDQLLEGFEHATLQRMGIE